MKNRDSENRLLLLPPISRILIATIFILAGLGKIPGWNETLGFMASKGMPFVPVFLALAIGVEIVGGLALLVGYRTRIAAAVLFFYLIPVTLIFHNFWGYEGMEAQGQFVNFMKNLAIMGGLLSVVYFGAGTYSVDERRSESAKDTHTGPSRLRKAA